MRSDDLHEHRSPLAVTLDHGARVAAHRHRFGQVIYPATGLLTVTTATGSWIAPANRAVWTPAGYEHDHRIFGTADIRLVSVPVDLANELPERPAVLAVSGLLREILMALTGSSQRARSATARLLQVAVDELVEAPEVPLHLPEPRDDRLRRVADLLRSDPADTSTLAELGRVVGASERTLTRLFNVEFEMGFRQWRTQLRIHHALVHLDAGESITRTALACGWANASTFIKAFTDTLGQTPGRYQNDLLHAHVDAREMEPKTES